MGLVDYGSDSDNDAPSIPPPKKGKGPVKILIDAPKISNDSPEPPKKRLKVSDKPSGLFGALPAPKNKAISATNKPIVPSKPDPVLVPAVLKGKAKAVDPPKVVEEPVHDFFGIENIGTSKPSVQLPNSRPKPPISTVSSAPTLPPPNPSDLSTNYYATVPPPTEADPYPGFYQTATGDWAALHPDHWEVWAAAFTVAQDQTSAEKAPKDFDTQEYADADVVGSANDRLKKLEDDKTEMEREIEREKVEKRSKEEAEMEKVPVKKFTHVAKQRHQLSHMLQDARLHKEEWEDRLSKAKATKKAAGAKYGF